MVVDCHTHPLGHVGGSYTLEKLRSFVEEGIAKGIKGIGFTDHEWYKEEIDHLIVKELQEEYPDFKIFLGIEFDYLPGREQEIQEILQEKPYDYAIGSVHEIDGWPFDHPDYEGEYEKKEINLVYQRYFEILKKCVASGLFQLVGHLDLIKILGYRYQGNLLSVVAPLLDVIKKQGMAVEINTNGLCKPVKEVYPSKEILKECIEIGIPIAFSSDAHEAQEVGRELAYAKEILSELGCKELAYFSQGKIQFTPLIISSN